MKLKNNPYTREANLMGSFGAGKTDFVYNFNYGYSERDIRVTGDEYHRIAIAAFDEMMEEIREDVVEATKKFPITENGIDMNSAGLIGATSTRTYMIDESKSQFRKIPHLIKTVSNRINGPVFTVQGLLKKFRQRGKKE